MFPAAAAGGSNGTRLTILETCPSPLHRPQPDVKLRTLTGRTLFPVPLQSGHVTDRCSSTGLSYCGGWQNPAIAATCLASCRVGQCRLAFRESHRAEPAAAAITLGAHPGVPVKGSSATPHFPIPLQATWPITRSGSSDAPHRRQMSSPNRDRALPAACISLRIRPPPRTAIFILIAFPFSPAPESSRPPCSPGTSRCHPPCLQAVVDARPLRRVATSAASFRGTSGTLLVLA